MPVIKISTLEETQKDSDKLLHFQLIINQLMLTQISLQAFKFSHQMQQLLRVHSLARITGPELM